MFIDNGLYIPDVEMPDETVFAKPREDYRPFNFIKDGKEFWSIKKVESFFEL